MKYYLILLASFIFVWGLCAIFTVEKENVSLRVALGKRDIGRRAESEIYSV